MDYTFRHLRGRRVAAAALIIILIYNLRQIYARTIKQLGTQSAHVKPQKITVSGLVFYGRKDRASCMHSYLERNLVDNGGWLDEVLWVANTNDTEDLRYLDRIITKHPTRYKKLVPTEKLWENTYYKAWQYIERGKYYVKIDDDIVWIDDDAIPQLVSRKLHHPADFAVSANIINNPPLGFLHYHIGAVHPYLPETERPENVSESWKPSEHPFWNGPDKFTWPLDKDPPYDQHRWLRVRDDKEVETPAAKVKYEVWGDSYSSWAIAAQMHYSLLENIENNRLDRYKFNKPWNMDGERIRINFMCIYADDLLNTDIEHWPRDRSDEDMIVIDLPQHLRLLMYNDNAEIWVPLLILLFFQQRLRSLEKLS